MKHIIDEINNRSYLLTSFPVDQISHSIPPKSKNNIYNNSDNSSNTEVVVPSHNNIDNCALLTIR